MPAYAVLGATGSTGSSLLRYLHERPDNAKIKIYARSASKVESLHPYAKTAESIQNFIGGLSDTDTMKDCLKGVDAIFSTVAQNSNEPGCSIAQRTSHSIVSALEALRKEEGSEFNCPTLVFLSSACLNDRFVEQTPRVVIWVIERANYHVYEDLRKSVDYLKKQAWIPLITAQPPALVKDISRGYKLSLEEAGGLVSYDDLARGMVQMAEEDGGRKWVGQSVGVVATGNVKSNIWPLIKFEFVGLIAYFFPAVWHLGNGTFW